MSDVILMCIVCIGLIGWILHLQYRLRYMAWAMQQLLGLIYEGDAEIEKLNDKYVPKPSKKLLQCITDNTN